jgi:hypothetical protein
VTWSLPRNLDFAKRRNVRLRLKILAALERGELTVPQVALKAYRLPASAPTLSQEVAVRTALRRLATRGKIVSTGKLGRRKLFALAEYRDPLGSISLGGFE